MTCCSIRIMQLQLYITTCLREVKLLLASVLQFSLCPVCTVSDLMNPNIDPLSIILAPDGGIQVNS